MKNLLLSFSKIIIFFVIRVCFGTGVSKTDHDVFFCDVRSAFMCFWNGTEYDRELDDPFLFKDASFIVRDPVKTLRLKQSKFISLSLESVNYRGHFLKYFDGNVVVQELKNSETDYAAATWIFENSAFLMFHP